MAHAGFTAAHAARDGELLRAGDSASLGLLLERHRPRLYALAPSMLGFGAEAEDAVHDAFVTALVRLPQLADVQAAGGWLHAIVRNRRLMELRRRKAGAAAVDDAEAALAERAAEDCVARRIESAQLRDWVWSAPAPAARAPACGRDAALFLQL
jgi:DNA-directed RNA polymerase specialized sigma24 family protein